MPGIRDTRYLTNNGTAAGIYAAVSGISSVCSARIKFEQALNAAMTDAARQIVLSVKSAS